MQSGLPVTLASRAASSIDTLWSRLVVASALVHAAALAVMAWVPGVLGTLPEPEPREVMSISLGGAPGPRAGGMTPLGGRPVQQAVPEKPNAPPEPVRPPAARRPEMTIQKPEAKPLPPRREMLTPAPDEARGHVPTQGPREQLGSTIAATGGEGVSLGLSTGGGGAGGEITLGDFCCPDYLQVMLSLVQRGWSEKQPVSGTTTMRFTITRDGTFSTVEVARSSGYAALDLAAERAVRLSKMPPLPAAYPNAELTINLNFQYRR